MQTVSLEAVARIATQVQLRIRELTQGPQHARHASGGNIPPLQMLLLAPIAMPERTTTKSGGHSKVNVRHAVWVQLRIREPTQGPQYARHASGGNTPPLQMLLLAPIVVLERTTTKSGGRSKVNVRPALQDQLRIRELTQGPQYARHASRGNTPPLQTLLLAPIAQ